MFNYFHENGVGLQVHYIPIHFLDYYKKITNYKKGDFPNAEKIANTTLSLPVHEFIQSKHIKFVSRIINNFYGIK